MRNRISHEVYLKCGRFGLFPLLVGVGSDVDSIYSLWGSGPFARWNSCSILKDVQNRVAKAKAPGAQTTAAVGTR